MPILNQTPNVPQEIAEITDRHYALAAFIMGCLIQAGVVQINKFDNDEWSDLQCGIRIVAACVKDFDQEDGRYKLPFQW